MTDESDRVVTRYLLERGAASSPDEVFVTFSDGTTWTRRAGLEHAYTAANVLRSRGVGQGDRVAVFLPNGADFLRTWWGAAVLGATLVPVNVSYRSAFLANLINLAQPVVAVGSPELMARLDELDDPVSLPRVDAAEVADADNRPPELERRIEFWDPAVLLMTSGTTGPSKLAVNTYLHCVSGGGFITERSRGPEDTFLVDLPLFHGAALWQVFACLATGTRMVVHERPDLARYWEVLAETGTTLCTVLSTMGLYLWQQPSREAETRHPVRSVQLNPLPADVTGWRRRFAIPDVYANYGSTEMPAPLRCDPRDELVPGYCGRVAAGFESRIVDAHDVEVGPDEPGEFVVRSEPWRLCPEYVGNPEATATMWRNGWFHSGDMLRRDAEGRFYFVDRIKDALRRRGENISSVELEAEILTHPAVAEVACVPHRPDGGTDDEVKAWLLVAGGHDLDFAGLLKYCADRLPHFMVPRYFEVTIEFPRTPSGRVKKHELRALGNSDTTWDREANGYTVTRTGMQITA
ncbi:MAG TPA: AMP-binding protein [Pseudonocardia sp.]|jgi:crotonobetaine/carnitine-CoA ligase